VAARQARAQEKGLEILVTQRCGGPRIMADPDGLRVIFGNLLGNAIKYSTPAAKTVEVDLSTERGVACVCIRDKGIGIPPEDQAKIFDEFHRGSNVTSTHASGFGLGLAIVRELVDRYGGRIELRSQIGEGTSVTVSFPPVSDADPSRDSA
jgi:signal transduction histidine kinase